MAISKRLVLLLSLFALVSSILLPIWWNTTGAYQTPIPHDLIHQITNSSQCSLQLSFEVIIVANTNVNNEQTDIWRYESNHGISWNQIPIDQMENQIEITFGKTDSYRLFIFEQLSHSHSNHLFFGHSKNSFLFISTPAIESSVSSHWIPLYQKLLRSSEVEGKNQLVSVDSKTIPLRLTFSLINMDPSNNNRLVDWNFENLVSQSSLKEFLETLQPIFDLQLDSQLLHYGKLPSSPKWNSNTKQYSITAKEMQTILNANDWKLISPSNQEKNIHVLFLIPPASADPLWIEPYQSSSHLQDAFIIPQFGSVIMVNDLFTNNTNGILSLTSDRFVNCLETAMKQLRILLGIPCLEGFCSTFLTEKQTMDMTKQVTYLRRGMLLSAWERDQLLIQKSQQVIRYAKESLQLTSDFVNQMRDIIVREQVVDLVQYSLQQIVKYHHGTCNLFFNTEQLEQLYQLAKEALKSSEEAYYHPSLLALLYFPQTQKLAVFLPVTLPLFITLVSAMIREFKYQKAKRK